MPEYQVILEPVAIESVSTIGTWIANRSPDGAARWYEAFRKAIFQLQVEPTRFAIAPESRHFEDEVRHLIFKTRQGRPYRLLFTVREPEVHVLFVRGPGQDWLPKPD